MELKVAHPILKMMTIAVIFLALPLLDTMAMYANNGDSSHRSSIVKSSHANYNSPPSDDDSDHMQNGGGYGHNPYTALKEQSQRESQQANRPSNRLNGVVGIGGSSKKPSDRLNGVVGIGSPSKKPAESSHHYSVPARSQSLHNAIVPARSSSLHHAIVPARSSSLHHAIVPAQPSSLHHHYSADQTSRNAPSDRTTHFYSGSDSPAEPKKMASPWQRKMANIGDNTGGVLGGVLGVAGAVPGLLLGPFGLFAGGMAGAGVGLGIGGAIKYVGTGFNPPSRSELWRANQDKMERDYKKEMNGS